MGNISSIAGSKICEYSDENIIHCSDGALNLRSTGKIIQNSQDKIEHGRYKETIAAHKSELNAQPVYSLPLLIAYSRGYDYTHHFMDKTNDELKSISLSLEDSTANFGQNINIRDCDELIGVDQATLRKNMKDLLYLGAKKDNGAKQVGEAMLEKFWKSEGGIYETDMLTQIINKDDNFNEFKKRVGYKVLLKLKSVNWDLSKIINDNNLARFDNVAFNTSKNHEDGLTILIDEVEHVEVYISKYEPPPVIGGICKIELKFVLYDTFGLDRDDIKKYGKRSSTSAWRHITDWDNDTAHIHIQNVYGLGFTSWWLLQHRFLHFPFVTKITILQEGYFEQRGIYQNPDPKKADKNSSNELNYK